MTRIVCNRMMWNHKHKWQGGYQGIDGPSYFIPENGYRALKATPPKIFYWTMIGTLPNNDWIVEMLQLIKINICIYFSVQLQYIIILQLIKINICIYFSVQLQYIIIRICLVYFLSIDLIHLYVYYSHYLSIYFH
jgi:hypothetical protein